MAFAKVSDFTYFFYKENLKMKKFILLCLALGIVIIAQSQTISIKDSETGEALEMVTLTSSTPKAYATTNAQGQADISTFKTSLKIEIRSVGYKTEVKSYAELEKQNFEIFLSMASTLFDEIVISATRWSQSSRDIPSKISIISPKDVALSNPQTAADLLGLSGEVFIQKSQQGGGSPMIRGFSSNRLLYTVDGVRMNTAIFRSGNIQNVISLDPLAIENAEVFFGPGSIIYGSDAIGGVMSFKSLTPKLSLTDKAVISGKAVSRFSSANNEITNHIDVGVGWKKWASVTSFTFSNFGDLKMGKNGHNEYRKTYYVQRIDGVDSVIENPNPLVQNPSGYSQINLMQKIRYKPNEKWDFQYGFHYSETSDFSRYDRLIETQANGLPVAAVWNYGPQIWMMNNLTISQNSQNKLYNHMSIRLAHQYFEESRIDRRLNHHRLRTQLEEVQAYSANIDLEKSVYKFRFYYGVEFVHNEVKSKASAVDIRDGSPILVPDRYPASEWSSYAAYLNYQYIVSGKLLLQAGARFSAFSIASDFARHLAFYPFDFASASTNNSSTTGSIGAVYKPSDTWKISANLSTGFRAPNVDDIGKIFDFANGEIVVPNTNLSAEYAYNAELNISKIFNDAVKLDLTGFYTYLDNALVRRTFQVNGQDSIMFNEQMSQVYAIQNAAKATVYGFNVGIEIKLPSGFSITSRYNYQLGEEEMDNGNISRSRHAAPAFGTTRLSYKKSKWLMQCYAMYSAEVSYVNLNEEERQKAFIYASDANGNPYSPSWYTLNVKAMYQFHKNISASAGLENITDQGYRPYSSGMAAAGRNLILSLRLTF
jgi:hemoglobin/transferrin/lactoferrin receptor protein